MNIVKKAEAFMQAVGKGDAVTAFTYITEDFTVSGPTPQPRGTHEFLGLHSILATAFPDFDFNISQVEEEGDKVTVTIAISGTQTGTLDVSPTGMPIPPVAPTGKKVQMPQEKPVLTVRDGKFSALYLPTGAGGGLPGILSQLGVALPAHA